MPGESEGEIGQGHRVKVTDNEGDRVSETGIEEVMPRE